jgi:hypothetical protein
VSFDGGLIMTVHNATNNTVEVVDNLLGGKIKQMDGSRFRATCQVASIGTLAY